MDGRGRGRVEWNPSSPQAAMPSSLTLRAPSPIACQSDEKEPPKKRAKKDKNAPKKGMSAFMMFSNDVRDSVRSENPDASFGDMGKIIGARWKVRLRELPPPSLLQKCASFIPPQRPPAPSQMQLASLASEPPFPPSPCPLPFFSLWLLHP